MSEPKPEWMGAQWMGAHLPGSFQVREYVHGLDVRIYPLAKIVCDTLVIGDNVIVDDGVLIICPHVEIGNHVHIGAYTTIMGHGKFTLRDFSGLSGHVAVYTSNEQYGGECLTNASIPMPWRERVSAPVVVNEHAIVGAHVTLLPGVTIGEGAVVAAYALVKNDVLPWSVVGGQPARFIKQRPFETIKQLEADYKATVYDADGRYRPKAEREDAT